MIKRQNHREEDDDRSKKKSMIPASSRQIDMRESRAGWIGGASARAVPEHIKQRPTPSDRGVEMARCSGVRGARTEHLHLI